MQSKKIKANKKLEPSKKGHQPLTESKTKDEDSDFEKSVTGLEADLRKLPGAKSAAQVLKAPLTKPPASIIPIPRNSDDDEDMESEEEEEEIDELVEWIPPDCSAKVIVTDVTVDDFTVTLRESERPEGFFSQQLT